ncbi:MAG: PIG-L family deacetylase [Candidatus Nanoarchaeia archaeon]|nr:PIG-L family deacetylase [Candidatus Nanoarchaeia archaeon]
MAETKEAVLVVCAHSDDQILGPGGALVKYSNEGKEIFTVIFSYGEISHLWLKKKVGVEIRVREAQEADKVIGGSGVVFFGLGEGNFKKEIQERDIKEKLKKIIKEKKPFRIFTHVMDDAHEDHRVVCNTVKEILDDIKFKGDLLGFDIWNVVDIKKRHLPKVYIDITDTFKLKMKALSCFKSQTHAMLIPYLIIYIGSFINGLKNDCKRAEKFYKIR